MIAPSASAPIGASILLLPLPTGAVEGAGIGPDAIGFSALLGAVETGVIAEAPATYLPDSLPLPDGKIGRFPGKILPDASSEVVEIAPSEDEPIDAMPLAQAAAIDPAHVPLPIALAVPVPIITVAPARPNSSHAPPPSPTSKAVRQIPVAATPVPVVVLSAITADQGAVPAEFQPQPARQGEVDFHPPVTTANALRGRGQVAEAERPAIAITPTATHAAQQSTPELLPPLAVGGKRPAIPIPVPTHADTPCPVPEPAVAPAQPATVPAHQDQAVLPPSPAIPVQAEAEAEAAGASRIAPAMPVPEAPQDFATLVGKLAEARETADPQRVRTALRHADFGPVALEFRHEDRGLSVTMTNGAPGFNGAVQAAVAASLAGNQAGDQPRDSNPQAAPSSPPGAASAGTGGGQPSDQRQPASADPRTGHEHPSGRRQGAQQDDRSRDGAPAQRSTGNTGRSGIYA